MPGLNMRHDLINTTLKILHVDDYEADFLIMRRLLAGISNLSIEIEWSETYKQALQILPKNQHHICLLDYSLEHKDGLELMQEAQKKGCTMPFIMLTGKGNEKVDMTAMQSGAAFYVDKNNLDAYNLERAIRYSLNHALLLQEVKEFNETLEQRVADRTQLLLEAKKQLEAEIAEREKIEEELRQLRIERGFRTLQNMSNAVQATVTSQLLGIKSIEDSAPDIFERLVNQYGEILEQAIQRRAYWVEDDKVSELLREMADEMGMLRLSPRDIVQIYNAALKHKGNRVSLPQKADAYVEEGRLTLLELMGNLVSYYRNHLSGSSDNKPRL